MKIVKNSLSKELLDQDPINSITSNLFTSIGEIIITKDDEIYQVVNPDPIVPVLSGELVSNTGSVIITQDDEVYHVVNK
jgi:hypothetical protein